MIVNEATKILPSNDFTKLKKILDSDEKRYGSLLQQNEKLNNVKKEFKEIKNNISFEQAKYESKRNTWKIEEQEQENKRKKWNLEDKEYQAKRETWDKKKNKIQEEKENLEQEKTQAKSELSSLKMEIKEKIETLKNEKKNNGEIQREALSKAIKELYEQNKTTYKDNEKIKETAKNEATKELRENYKNDKEITEKAKTEAYEDYKSNYKLTPEITKKIEEKVIKTKYDEILEDKDGKYTNLAKKKALQNKEFAQKIIKKATVEKKSEIEKDPRKIKEIVTEIKNECFVKPEKLRDSAILSELKKDWGLRTQVRDSLREDKYFRQEVINEIPKAEKTEIITNFIKNDMNSAERKKFLKSYIDKEKIRSYVTTKELQQAEKEAEKEVLGQIKNENINLYQNLINIANFFYDFYKKFVEEELKQQFENTTYESIYNRGIRTKNSNVFNKVVKSFCRIVNFFRIKNQYKKDEEKNEIKDELEDLRERLEIKENDRTQNKAF